MVRQRRRQRPAGRPMSRRRQQQRYARVVHACSIGLAAFGRISRSIVMHCRIEGKLKLNGVHHAFHAFPVKRNSILRLST